MAPVDVGEIAPKSSPVATPLPDASWPWLCFRRIDTSMRRRFSSMEMFFSFDFCLSPDRKENDKFLG
jgi:hypothetical protein